MRVAVATIALLSSCLLSGAAAAGLSLDGLYAEDQITQVAISPDGVAVAVLETTGVVLVGIWGQTPMSKARSSPFATRFEWIDDSRLLVSQHRKARGSAWYEVVEVELVDGELVTHKRPIGRDGWVVDSLPGVAGEVLWADVGQSTTVYRIPIEKLYEKRLIFSGASSKSTKLKMKVLSIVSDREGTPLWAFGLPGDATHVELWSREDEDSDWRTIWRSVNGGELRIPVGLNPANGSLIVASNEGRDTFALFELDQRTLGLGRLLFARDGVDVEGVVVDYTGREVLAVRYEEGGQLRYHNLGSEEEARQRGFEYSLPGADVHIVSMSRDRRFQIGLAVGPRYPGSYYFVDTQAKEASLIAHVLPGVPSEELVEVEHFTVASDGGVEVDAFFARPRRETAGPPPLIVLPHGGPVGARDLRIFDPTVQYLADGRFAVLQVNYRGSSGRGRRFQEAGHGEWGRGIEDDIDAAVEHVIDAGWVDSEMICIAGFSYGGYSALISLVRHPERYRCAATFAAPTDIPLIFQSSDFAADEEGRKLFAEVVGDPSTQYDELVEVSPAYRANEIDVPVLLGHGSSDERVDIEHMYRMQAMLDAYGKSYEVYIMEGAGHWPRASEFKKFIVSLRDFVSKSLRE